MSLLTGQFARAVIVALCLVSPLVTAQSWRLTDTAGRVHTPEEWRAAQSVVFFFIATECPISNRYAPEINRIAAAHEKRGIKFYAVHSDPDVTAEVARQHAQDYGYRMPILLDPAQRLAQQFGVTLTPTAIIITPNQELLYRGRIDNQHVAFGKYRPRATRHDLRDALATRLRGKAIRQPFPPGIGCALPPPNQLESSKKKKS
jgi:peroxiredoxin